MKPLTLRGMTWDHRRAIDPLVNTLAMFAARHPDITVEWSSRPLSGFEFTPVADLARHFDLIILDHPFMGAVATSKCLLPLDGICGDDATFVGPSLSTYRMDGRVWALPVDAACQVAVSRPDLMQALDTEAPADWAGLMQLGQLARRKGQSLAIGLKGVHSLMTFFTLMANLGSPCAVRQDQAFADRAVARHVLGLMRALLDLCPPQVLDWNSIALHDAMVRADDLVFCPAVYCYATYAESDQRRPLRFHDLPGPKGHGGSTIGGTGLAVSAHTRHAEAALAYVRFAAASETQCAFAMHHGQPAHREAWRDPAINARFGNCFHDTQATMDACWTRPRYDGYLAFQEKGGELVEQHLRNVIAADALLDALEALHRGR
jgi:multiple sugar transport system substrate-binding protein